MSLIIKGMQLPQSCSTCRFSYFTVGIRKRCEISGDEVNPLIDCRETNCPLVEIPTPHGRLIDADNLVKVLQNTLDNYPDNYNDEKTVEKLIVTVCKRYIENTPTVIEAEVSE